MNYLDFDLKIERAGTHFLARVLRSPGGEGSHTFDIPFNPDKLENLILRMTRLRGVTRRIESPEKTAARELGEGLYTAVFGPAVLGCLQRSIERARREQETGVRIRLRLQEAAELADLPWEFLRDPFLARFLAQSNQTPIVRYIELPDSIPPLAGALPLRLLVLISRPTDYATLDVEREKRTLQEALAPLIASRAVEIEWLEEASLPALQRRLRTGRFHVFHFIGHGGFEPDIDEGVLVLTEPSGRGHRVPAHRLGMLLHDHSTLRLALLNACEGARNSFSDPFAGVATTLVRDGIPAVIAMQFEISDESAICFAHEFYGAVADGLPVDAAVAEARKAIPNDVEWGTPVLYMRSEDGVLFRLESPAPPHSDFQVSPDQQRVQPENAPPVPDQRRAELLEQTTPAEARAKGVRKAEDPPRRRKAKRKAVAAIRPRQIEQRFEAPPPIPLGPPEVERPAPQAAPAPTVARPDCVLVEGGTFRRGAGFLSQTVITVSAFWIGRHAVTVREYDAYCSANPGVRRPDMAPDERCPVTDVSWHEAVAYCDWLSHASGATFRLPTEAEWEFAARGGNRGGRFRFAGSNKAKEVAWFDKNAGGQVHPVGQKPPNELGIHDMSGNVAEWCLDWYADYPSEPATDPFGPDTGTSRVMRGGSWKHKDTQAQVDARDLFAPALRLPFVGFRVVMKP